ncbi:hypothetical protein CFO_g3883 [Ceratocystis platani]|uniref:Uncharacterized protein n=1 Tax=Ceratocystis fimbriata f. sp. platani TaxID=88771 RepID=A0A0F8B204_CERFI|nr:hypothetical protein CFO_g3883 [Ceratocystis platani]
MSMRAGAATTAPARSPVRNRATSIATSTTAVTGNNKITKPGPPARRHPHSHPHTHGRPSPLLEDTLERIANGEDGLDDTVNVNVSVSTTASTDPVSITTEPQASIDASAALVHHEQQQHQHQHQQAQAQQQHQDQAQHHQQHQHQHHDLAAVAADAADTQRQLQNLSAAANLLANSTNDPTIHPELQRLSAVDNQSAIATAARTLDQAVQDQLQDMQTDSSIGAAAAASLVMDTTSGSTNENNFETAEILARASGYTNLDIESAASTLSKRLAPQPGRRIAVQRRQDQTLNLGRRSNVEALLAHIAGNEAASACKNCHKGHGPWNTCVVVEGQMCGSCANCWYNASGSRCSFHETNNPQAHQPALHNNRASAFHSQAAASRLSQTSQGLLLQPNAAFSATSATQAQGIVAADFAALHSGLDDEATTLIEKAFREVREGSARARHLLAIDAAAKQLALRMHEYDVFLQTPEGAQMRQEELESLRSPDPASMNM